MPLPRLLHPIKIEVLQIEKKTKMDTVGKYPKRHVYRKKYTFQGQVRYRSIAEPEWAGTGAADVIEGWVTTVKNKLNNYIPKRGDKFVKFGNQDVSVYLTNIEYLGQYKRGFTLIRLHFMDRLPVNIE